jgi:hypothetical protein
MGYIGSGGTVMGVSPLGEIANYLPGAQGSLLNNALASGTMGAGLGLLRGQGVGEALKSGFMSGAQTAGLQAMGLSIPNPKAALAADSGTNTAPHFIQGEQVSGPVSSSDGAPNIQSISGVGPASPRDFVTDAQIANQAPEFKPALNASYNLPAGEAPPTPGIPAPSQAAGPMAQAPSGGAAPKSPFEQAYGSPKAADVMGGGRAIGSGSSANSSILSRAEAFYDKPSFESFGKIFSDPNATTMIGKYGPGAAAVLGATALAGGFKSQPAETKPAFDYKYTGRDYIKDHPELFGGDLRAGQFSSRMPTGVPTGNMYFGGIPAPQVNAPMLPTYNTGPVMGRARGGNVDFPRKIGQIDGPGTATSDSIPAMLSDGEFVFTARAVRNAGGGSRRKGAAKMYKLMKSLENGPLGSK